MFADVDESIRRLLVERGNLNSGEIDISFDMPTREWAAGISRPTVNLYLYDVRENLELREPTPWQVRRGPNNTATKTKPDVRLDLTYSVTAFANAVEDEHRLLGRVALVLFQNPVLPEDLLQGEVAGQEIPAFIAQPSHVIQSPADYWGSIDNDIRPSLDYRVTVRLNLAQEVSVGLVLTSQFRVGEKVNGKGLANAQDLPYSIGGRIVQSGDRE
ncbi:MAG: DUF4255 domain-containing protein, partial [Chloroflexi bacterium]|nr:DUF4255 domain-containing protein [Chloroflexota bacterium]